MLYCRLEILVLWSRTRDPAGNEHSFLGFQMTCGRFGIWLNGVCLSQSGDTTLGPPFLLIVGQAMFVLCGQSAFKLELGWAVFILISLWSEPKNSSFPSEKKMHRKEHNRDNLWFGNKCTTHGSCG